MTCGMEVNGFTFKRLPACFCEEYNVLDSDGYTIAYVHLCYSIVSCEYPEINGRLVYSERVSNEGRKNHFDSDAQRLHYLTKVSERLHELMDGE